MVDVRKAPISSMSRRSGSKFMIEDEEEDSEVEVQLYENKKVPDMYTPIPSVIPGEDGKDANHAFHKGEDFVPLELDENDRTAGLSKEASCLAKGLSRAGAFCSYITCERRCIFFQKIQHENKMLVGDEVTL